MSPRRTSQATALTLMDLTLAFLTNKFSQLLHDTIVAMQQTMWLMYDGKR
jgi:hypothetical protein